MGVAHSQEERRGDEAAGAALDAVPHAPGALADDEALTPQEAAAVRAQAAVLEAEARGEARGEAALKAAANAEAPEEAEAEAAEAAGEAEMGDAGENGAGDENSSDAGDGAGRAVVLRTAPIDHRFPTANQARRCFTNVLEAHRCRAQRGDDAPECAAFTRAYRSVCPQEWIARWQELRDEGRWFGKY